MRLARLSGVVGVGCILLAFAGGAAAQGSQDAQPSLGEVVKQKPARKAAKVITNDDLPKPPADEAAATTAAPGAAAAEAAKPPSASATDAAAPAAATDQAATQTPAEEDPLAKRLRLSKADEDASKARLDQLRKELDAAPDDATAADVTARMQREQNMLAVFTNARAAAEKDYADAQKAKEQAQKAAQAPAPPAAPAPQ